MAMVKSGKLTGIFKDDDNIPLAGVTVKCNSNLTTTTDTNGEFVFENLTPDTQHKITASKEYYKNLNKTEMILSGDNKKEFVMSIDVPFMFDDGDTVFKPSGNPMLLWFEECNVSLSGKITKTVRIRNNRQKCLSWSLSNIPSYGITFSPPNGTIAAEATVSITATFLYPSSAGFQNGKTRMELSSCTKGKVAYVWNWAYTFAGRYYDNGWNYNSCSASCVQQPIINIGEYTEGFDLIFNQFIISSY